MKNPFCVFPLLGLLVISASCSKPDGEREKTEASVTMAEFGTMADGTTVHVFTLTNENGLEAKVIDYGAHLISMNVPDQEGKFEDVTLGYDDLEGWLGNTSYFGATVGRYANRIANGKFTLEGEEYTLATNNEPGGIPCALHGGVKGFDKQMWKGEIADGSVILTYISSDGEEGYPGELTTTVTYKLTADNELVWEAKATTDAATVVNLAQHTYWNLTGTAGESINDHELTLNADHYLPTNKGLIPTGELAAVEDTPMDFREATKIGERVDETFEALEFGGGYDHCWVLNAEEGMTLAATVYDPSSGRVMELSTNQPAVQFYGGNFLDGSAIGKGGKAYTYRTGLALETQHFPDSPNQPKFPSTVLRPGETYHHKMVTKFSIK